jgi:hypothetical protein
MKVKSEDILKPGAVLTVEKIDFNSPEVKRILRADALERQKAKRIKTIRFR